MNLILAVFGFGNTKHTTDTTNKYDSQSMNIFHQLSGSGNNVMQQYMQDPLKASYFLNQVGMLNRVSQQVGQRSMNSLIGQRGMSGGGSGIMPGWLQSNMARIGRNTGAMQGQNVLQALMGAESRRYNAAGNALNYKPLQTGQSTEEQTSGLGTWLPQVIGMAAQGAMAFGTGGASAIGGASKAGGGIAGAGGGASSFFHPGGFISQNTNPLGNYNFGGN